MEVLNLGQSPRRTITLLTFVGLCADHHVAHHQRTIYTMTMHPLHVGSGPATAGGLILMIADKSNYESSARHHLKPVVRDDHHQAICRWTRYRLCELT